MTLGGPRAEEGVPSTASLNERRVKKSDIGDAGMFALSEHKNMFGEGYNSPTVQEMRPT